MTIQEWHGCYDDGWGNLIVPEAYGHPAKFSRGLIERIVTHGLECGYWKVGSLVIDPFGGVALGGIICGYHGLNWIGIELESSATGGSPFVELGNRNIDLHRAKWVALGYKVDVRLIQGDSRAFSEIVQASGIVTSPPFADCFPESGDPKYAHKFHGSQKSYGSAPGQIGRLPAGSVGGVITSPPYAETSPEKNSSGIDIEKQWQTYRAQGGGMSLGKFRTQQARHSQGYGSSEGQIGRLPAGSIDSIVTSPPFLGETSAECGPMANQQIRAAAKSLSKSMKDISPFEAKRKHGYGTDPQNIGNLKSGSIDACITSPPFSDCERGGTGVVQHPNDCKCNWCAKNKGNAGSVQGGKWGIADHANIGNLHGGSIDAVVTSPPWENQEPSHAQGSKFEIPHYKGGCKFKEVEYGQSNGQIGNSAGETYWEACRQVYAQCRLALKPGGYMAVVVKSYVKAGKIVDLPGDTLKLLVHLGFEPVERIHAMLTKTWQENTLFEGSVTKTKERKSFFRQLAEKKGSPRIDFEEVLFVKNLAQGLDGRSESL